MSPIIILSTLLLAALLGSRAAPTTGVNDDKYGGQEQFSPDSNWTKLPELENMLKTQTNNATGKPTPTGSSKQTYGYLYYYTDEMWYVNPTSYVGTLGFICVAVVLHIIVCTMRQKPSTQHHNHEGGSSCSVDVDPRGGETPPPPYRLFYKSVSVPPPPDYDTAAKLSQTSQLNYQPPPNYSDIAPVHRCGSPVIA